MTEAAHAGSSAVYAIDPCGKLLPGMLINNVSQTIVEWSGQRSIRGAPETKKAAPQLTTERLSIRVVQAGASSEPDSIEPVTSSTIASEIAP